MTKKNLPLAAAVGAAFIASASLNVSAGVGNANPFAAEELSSGYNLAMLSEHGDDKKKEGKCGEGKCGEEGKKKEGEGKCGEGKCGEEGEHEGMEGMKEGEGKCGEGKCGA
ncbi:hypothetical protein [Microbulbifer yueqingensis]|uniref:Low-complexity protein n=1 Tax=Microbulbifer yueqingensis TaxID=658219 RepID=A0A1G8VNI5_9GAMM|nr:hypothetical protein [Microbulbifer yueqingensis]SDJ67638.1 hypothetical protein SAMN05216212_0657 [Microbulbifer yueqingensis]